MAIVRSLVICAVRLKKAYPIVLGRLAIAFALTRPLASALSSTNTLIALIVGIRLGIGITLLLLLIALVKVLILSLFALGINILTIFVR
jgi:hypothetical protein